MVVSSSRGWPGVPFNGHGSQAHAKRGCYLKASEMLALFNLCKVPKNRVKQKGKEVRRAQIQGQQCKEMLSR